VARLNPIQVENSVAAWKEEKKKSTILPTKKRSFLLFFFIWQI
jgi:hypothetical protein